MPPILGAIAPKTGCQYVCFDATPLLYFNAVGRLGLLEEWFAPTAYTPVAVMTLELGVRHKQNAQVLSAPWLYWVRPHEDDTEFIAGLHRRFDSGKGKNRGEADLIAACRRYGWTAILEDEDGRLAARDFGIRHVYMATLLAAAAARGQLAPRQAFKVHVALESSRGHYSPLKSDAASRDVFTRFWQMLCKLQAKTGPYDLAHLLAVAGLDDLLVGEIKLARAP